MSPFEVTSTNQRGYYEGSSMSGTRFKTNLQDLAAVVSVMTKSQMEDFGMIDLNDIFLYTANAEGIGTYSDFVIDRNGLLTDNVQLSPNTANRVRGITSANISYGNFETSTRMPLDPLIIEGVEISRGPNANVFGLGNPAGTVNQMPSLANTTRNRYRTEFRVDDYGGHRASIDANMVLIKHKLAVRASALDGREAFMRKPSGIDTRRYNAMVRYTPFKGTTINAAYYFYRAAGNRPNFTTPRDYISYWKEMGSPTWNPVTQTVHVGGVAYDNDAVRALGNSNGTYNDTFLNQTGQLWNALSRNGAQFQRSNVFILPGQGTVYWTTPGSISPTADIPSPAGNGAGTNANNIRLMGTSPGPNGASGKFTDQPLFNSVPAVSDRTIYDYASINLSAPNYIYDKVHTYYATLDQFFINTARQQLVAQLGYFREDAKRFRRTPVGDAGGAGGVNGQLWVDVNETNLDGTPNPYLGYTYIGVSEPTYSYIPLHWETLRAQLSYKYNFATPGASKFLRWLGLHQLSPYYEYKSRVERKYSYRETITSSPAWLQSGQPNGSSTIPANFSPANQANISGGPQAGPNVARVFQRYYVGDASGGNVDWAPGSISHGTFPFHWGAADDWRADPTTLGLLATTDQTGGSRNTKRIIKTWGAVIQSHWLDGLLITTLGIRRDETSTRFGREPQKLVNGNTEHDFDNDFSWADLSREGAGTTKTAGFVARPFRDLPFVNRWAGTPDSAATRFLGTLLRDSSLYYNFSDNFIPEAPAFDLFLRQLPNQTGEGRDMGLWLNLLDNKLAVRLNYYNNKQLNVRDGDANTVAQRVFRLDRTNDRHSLYTRATAWWSMTNPGLTPAQIEDKVFAQMGLTREQYYALDAHFAAGTLAATNDVTAKGFEIEINYNPTPNWTIAFNAEEKRSINNNVSSSVQEWIDYRMPVWTTIVDQNYDPDAPLYNGDVNSTGWEADASNPGHLWFIHSYGAAGNTNQTAAENLAVNVLAPYSILRAQEGKSRPQVRRYAFRLSTNYRFAGVTENPTLKKMSVGGALRWEAKGSIGYYGVEEYPAVITALDPNRPIWDKSHAYLDVNLAYRTRMFNDKVQATFRLNIRNLFENGRLQPIGAFPNGEYHSYRIIDPRQFILSATFDM
jgi:outer membrane receptor for ferric coprogen and ferric-rhodotorulic acid